MEATGDNDLNVYGRGNVSGGTYNRVNIHGNGQVEGNIACVRLNSHGKSGFNGNVEAQFFEVNGDSTFMGNVEGLVGNIHGRTKVLGNLKLKEIEIHGQGDIKGDWEADRLKMQGSVAVGGTCIGNQVFIRGQCDFRGSLRANNLELRLHANSSATEVEGGFIHIKRAPSFGFLWLIQSLFRIKIHLTAQSIEGEVVILENTRAKVVRGNRVIIGPRCEIEHVEYRSNFQQHKGSIVNNKRRLD